MSHVLGEVLVRYCSVHCGAPLGPDVKVDSLSTGNPCVTISQISRSSVGDAWLLVACVCAQFDLLDLHDTVVCEVPSSMLLNSDDLISLLSLLPLIPSV